MNDIKEKDLIQAVWDVLRESTPNDAKIVLDGTKARIENEVNHTLKLRNFEGVPE